MKKTYIEPTLFVSDIEESDDFLAQSVLNLDDDTQDILLDEDEYIGDFAVRGESLFD